MRCLVLDVCEPYTEGTKPYVLGWLTFACLSFCVRGCVTLLVIHFHSYIVFPHRTLWPFIHSSGDGRLYLGLTIRLLWHFVHVFTYICAKISLLLNPGSGTAGSFFIMPNYFLKWQFITPTSNIATLFSVRLPNEFSETQFQFIFKTLFF